MDNDNGEIVVTPPPFQVDEKVYCKDNERYYEAIIRKSRYDSNNKWSFLVHYTGWNDRWDRWMEGDCILKDTAENRGIVQNRKEEQENAVAGEANNNTSGQKRSRGTSTDAASRSGSSRKRLTTVRNNVAADTCGDVYADYCELPFTLKTVLIDEYERLRRLVHVLPAPVPVRKVLNHFAKKKIKACKNGETTQLSTEQIQDFVQGLTQLFQEALPVCLLYPQERLQYASLKDSGDNSKELVDVYGCEFLLRLFVRLPILLQQTPRKEFSHAATVIGPLLTDLLVLLQKNRQTLFPMSIAPAENANYRLPLPNEWMNWGKGKKQQPSSPVVEMDTR
jgi:mortality factor 4-like protein 1